VVVKRLGLAYLQPDIILLDDPLSAVDVHVGKHIFQECIRKTFNDKTVILVTHQLNYVKDCDYVVYMKGGKIHEQGTYESLMEDGKEFSELIASFTQPEESSGKSENVTENSNIQVSSRANEMIKEEREIGGISYEIYKSYLKAAGGPWAVFFILFLTTLSQVTKVGNDLWLAAWTGHLLSPELSDNFYAGIYFVWGVVQGIAFALTGIVVSHCFARASSRFYREAIVGIFNAPVSLFDRTPLGRILNRFSKDTDAMDNQLPISMQFFLSIAAGLVGR
jgi:ATP-binding cassette subfamily C (CFTR/MRP) protein 1